MENIFSIFAPTPNALSMQSFCVIISALVWANLTLPFLHILDSISAFSTNRDARSSGEHSGRNIHGCQLLEEKFGGIRNVNLRDLGLVLARSAFE